MSFPTPDTKQPQPLTTPRSPAAGPARRPEPKGGEGTAHLGDYVGLSLLFVFVLVMAVMILHDVIVSFLGR